MTDCILHITGSDSSLIEITRLLFVTAMLCGDPDGTRLNLPLYYLLKALDGTERNDGFVTDLNAGFSRSRAILQKADWMKCLHGRMQDEPDWPAGLLPNSQSRICSLMRCPFWFLLRLNIGIAMAWLRVLFRS